MCLTAFKLNNCDLEAFHKLKPKKLYQKCVECDGKEFYEFNDWIERER